MTFSKNAWKLISPIYKSILIHPFNLELTKGTLSKEKFQFYIQQDSIYLIDFARALAITASRANNPEDLVLLLDFSKGAVIAERELHKFYLDLYKINLNIEKAPGCFAYTHFLISIATNASYEEALAALLPCFWVYQEVGQYIYKNSIKDNPYQKWIDTYSGEEFQHIVESAIALTNRAAEKANKLQLSLMQEAFLTSTRLELAFWDSAYRMESWKN